MSASAAHAPTAMPWALSRGVHAAGEGLSVMEAVSIVAGEPFSSRPRSASPVLTDWFLVWNEVLADDARQALRWYVEPLARSRGSIEEEVTRQWLVIDWVLAHALPACLAGAGQSTHAVAVARLEGIRSAGALASAAQVVEAAAVSARRAHDAGWRAVAALAQPDAADAANRPPWRPAPGDADPRRVAVWGGLADGTRNAISYGGGLFHAAIAALGYGGGDRKQWPPAWPAIASAFEDSVAAIGWAGTFRLVTSAGHWSWRTPGDDAWRGVTLPGLVGHAVVVATDDPHTFRTSPDRPNR